MVTFIIKCHLIQHSLLRNALFGSVSCLRIVVLVVYIVYYTCSFYSCLATESHIVCSRFRRSYMTESLARRSTSGLFVSTHSSWETGVS